MVRKSGVEAPSPRSSSKRAAPHKPTPTRQSKRAKATTTKTSYVDPSSDEETGGQDSSPLRDSKESNLSGYEHEEIKDPSSGSDQEEEASSDEEAKPRKATGKGRLSKQSTLPSHKKQSQDKGLWKSGAKLAPGTQLIIKKPRAREAGETTYTNDTIHPNTMLFLKDLAKNNDRQWLKSTSALLAVRILPVTYLPGCCNLLTTLLCWGATTLIYAVRMRRTLLTSYSA
jgi:hypothetical protein